MNIVVNLDEISYENIFFNDSIKNTVIDNSTFSKLLYSNRDIVLNGIYIKVDINKNNNNNIITNLNILEKQILTNFNNHKLHNYKIKDQINHLITKLHISNKNTFSYMLKISGIWETNTIIGLTYKFIFL